MTRQRPVRNPEHRPFLVSYGGGHAQMIVAVAKELLRRGRDFDLLGLTTADGAFRRAGLTTIPVTELMDPAIADDVLVRATGLAPRADHPDITDEQTIAYYTVGFHDLVERYGLSEAERRVASGGRKAFEPVTAFSRLFERLRPTAVIATTSPRFELAALKAARELGIPSVAIGDMYLVAEQEWILDGNYADHLTIISDDVGRMLHSTGRLSSQLHVLGNPAFDALVERPGDAATRSAERARLGIGERTSILWPLGGAHVSVAGRQLMRPYEVARFLDSICERDPAFTYVLRPHPNWPVSGLRLQHGRLDAEASLEGALLAADLVCVEASTVGLQAVLRGIPTICYNFADYVLYPDFGWAAKADTLEELAAIILSHRYFEPPHSLRATIGTATRGICDLIERVERTRDAGEGNG